MKKLLTLLFAAGSISFASAQSLATTARPSFDDARIHKAGPVVGGGAFGSTMSARERDYLIQKINREFDAKIYSVKRNRYMRNNEKNREIRLLEKQRTHEIKMVNQRYTDINKRNSRNDRRRW